MGALFTVFHSAFNWIVDKIEKGAPPKLVRASEAKLMLVAVNKTDELDARGLAKLQRAGTLPTFGIGFILATVIGLEVGDVQRFSSPAYLAS